MIAILMIIGGVFLRLTPHLANFAPISAIALFGGAKLNKKFAILVPLIAMAISDYLLLYVNPYNVTADFSQIHPLAQMFHDTTLYVWGSFVLSGLIGIWLKKHQKPSYMVAGSFASSVIFFLITNFGAWATGMYSQDLSGLMQSYIMGLPFFRWTVLGDIFYSGVFFGVYELALRVKRQTSLAIS